MEHPDLFTNERISPADVLLVDVEAVEPSVPPRFSRLPFWSIALAFVAMLPIVIMIFVAAGHASKRPMIWPAYVSGLTVFASSLAALATYCANPQPETRKLRGFAIAGMLVNMAALVFVDIGGFAAIGISNHRAQESLQIRGPITAQSQAVRNPTRRRPRPVK